MLDPRRLLVLDAVLRAGSMSGAALELRYSPAAVSQQIAALEVEAGISLLRRLPRGVAPTAAGQVAGDHARLLREQLASASSAIGAVARGTSGPLRIASFPVVSAGLLPVGLMRLRSERADLTVSVDDRDAESALAGLHDGTIDIALIADFSNDGVTGTEGLDAVELGRAVISVMLPAGHRLARDSKIPMKMLLDEPWIQSGDAICAASVAHAAAGPARVPRITRHTKDMAATRGLVAAGLGIALVTALGANDDDDDVVIREVSPSPAYAVLAVLPPASQSLPAAVVLRGLLLETASRILSVEAVEVSAITVPPRASRQHWPAEVPVSMR